MACHIIFYADKLPFLLHLLLSENIFLLALGRSTVLLTNISVQKKKAKPRPDSHAETGTGAGPSTRRTSKV